MARDQPCACGGGLLLCFSFLIIGGFGTIIVSLFHLQIIQGEELRTRAINIQTQDVSLTAQRGRSMIPI